MKQKNEARDILIAKAKDKRNPTISYSDLAAQIKTIKFSAHDQRLFSLLEDISSEEDVSGRGMLSVLVVHKHGEQRPGYGFFELAKKLGRTQKDELQCWIEELNKVLAVWQHN